MVLILILHTHCIQAVQVSDVCLGDISVCPDTKKLGFFQEKQKPQNKLLTPWSSRPKLDFVLRLASWKGSLDKHDIFSTFTSIQQNMSLRTILAINASPNSKTSHNYQLRFY